MLNKRPTWQEYFMKMAYLIAERSTCMRRKVGAILVKNNQIISTGYNGAPKGIQHCDDVGCLRKKYNVPSGKNHELCRGLHAEQNAIIQAAVNGVSIKDTVLYCTNHPCVICAKMIINSEISKVIISQDYPDKLAKEMLKESEVDLILLKENSKELIFL